jgi:cytochrome c oxidase cbb3-type subunit 3
MDLKKEEVHVYDGIVEHDNFLPRWWLAILYGTIAFGFVYFMHYTFGPGASIQEEYERASRELEVAKSLAASGSASGTGGPGLDPASREQALRAWAMDAGHRSQGKAVYDGKCAVCHGGLGQGGIGPNLTDDHWIHGSRHIELAKVISEGVGDKGMPPWGALLKDDELKSVVAYVRSLHGTNPPGAKGPQGEKTRFE